MIILTVITTILSILSTVISITMFYKTRKLNNKFKVWKNLKGNDFDLQVISI
jgi:preprotein translocase subunit SecG